MKKQGNCIVGDPVIVDRNTADWLTVKLHPITFYRRFEEFQDGLEESKGLYTHIDVGPYVVVKFLEKEDMTAFFRRHHAYI